MEKRFTDDRKWNYLVVFLFACSVILRFLIADYTKIISVYNDELLYISYAKSLSNRGELLVRGLENNFYNALYSFLIAIPFNLPDMNVAVRFVTFINCCFMSSVIFPAYFIGKIISNNKVGIMIALGLILTLPDMTYTMTFMSENTYLPLVIWTFYFVLKGFVQKNRVWFNGIFAGLFSFLAYFNKEVGLYLSCAFIMTCAVTIIARYKEKKYDEIRHIMSLFFYFIVCFVVCLVGKKVILSEASVNYYGGVLSNKIGIYEILYMIYAFFTNILFTSLAFMIVPVILPIAAWKSLNYEKKITYVFALFSCFVGICAITYKINLAESLGNVSFPQHLRYLGPILAVFVLLAVTIISEGITKKVSIFSHKIYFSCLVYFCMGISFLCKDIQIGSHAAQTLLKYYIKVTKLFQPLSAGSEELSFNVGRIVLLFVFFAIIFLLGYWICRKKYVKALLGYVMLVSSLNLWNTSLAIKDFREYEVSEADVEEILCINDFLRNSNGNVLVLLKDSGYGGKTNGLIDTYLMDEEKVCYATADDLLQQYGEGCFELANHKIPSVSSMMRNKSYYLQIDELDYIIDLSNVGEKKVQFLNVEQIDIKGVNSYDIYKNIDNSSFTLQKYSYFPRNVGDENVIYPEDKVFYSQFPINDDVYVSREEGGCLIYGPYCEAIPGVYDVTYYYSYQGDRQNGSILGKADITMQGDFEPLSTNLLVGEVSVTIKDIVINETMNGCEFRISTDEENVVFNKISIKRTR